MADKMNNSALRFGSDRTGIRSDDVPLLTGVGQFSDDLNIVGQLYAIFVRAPVAHADVQNIDTTLALAIPDVCGVYTGEDLVAANIGAVPAAISLDGVDGKPMLHAPIPVMAHKHIRYVGEPLAIVVAENLGAAQLGADAVVLELGERPAAPTVAAACAKSAPVIHKGAPDNIALNWTDG
ncbi:uncharacterized protein METZ01_LOCUS349885, partial [marine metagenome]